MIDHDDMPLARRITRRGVLRGTMAGVGLAAAALVGCNGGGKQPTSGSGATATGTGTPAAAAKPRFGGTVKIALLADPPNWSVFTAANTTVHVGSFAYDKVIDTATGPGHGLGTADLVPQIATAMPETPDPQTYVFKIRQGVKFQNVAPVNGRPMTTEDVKSALDALRSGGAFKADFAAISSVTTPDAQTVIVKTSEPNAPLLNYMAGHYGWRIFPKEIIDSKIADKNAIGTGPYIRTQWDQGARIVFKRNPEYWNKDTAFVDEFQFLVVPEIAAQVAAFHTKQIDILPEGAACEQVQELAGQVKGRATSQPVPKYESGHAFNTTKAPFNDVRVRRAMSLAYNRASEAQALYCGKSTLFGLLPQKQALKPSDLPDMANYLKFDLKQAKDLLTAAGFGSGFKMDVAWTPQYNAGNVNYTTSLERYGGDLKQLGITINPVQYEYGKWIAEIYRPPYNFDGMMWSSTRYYSDPDPYVSYWLHPKGIANQSRINDPKVTELVEKQRRQLNPTERWSTLHEIQKIDAANQWYMRQPIGTSEVFTYNRVHDYIYHDAYDSHEFWSIWVDA